MRETFQSTILTAEQVRAGYQQLLQQLETQRFTARCQRVIGDVKDGAKEHQIARQIAALKGDMDAWEKANTAVSPGDAAREEQEEEAEA